MKPYRLLLSVPLLLACVAGALALWNYDRLFYPTPETESSFLRNYTPEQVIDRFREPNQSFSSTHGRDGAAGRVFVRHGADFEFHVVLRPEKWTPLMNTLRDDVLQQLAANGAEVLSQTGNPRAGFHFQYRVNRSLGSLTISPVAIDRLVRRNQSLAEGMTDVTVTIEQTERWFAKGAGTMQIAFRSSVQ